MVISTNNQKLLGLHSLKVNTASDDDKGHKCFRPAFRGKHALVP
jgi:hypothetical protein